MCQATRRDGIGVRVDIVVVGVVVVAAVVGDLVVGVSGPAKEKKHTTTDGSRFVSTKNIYIVGNVNICMHVYVLYICVSTHIFIRCMSCCCC